MNEQIPEDIREAARAFVPAWAYMDNRVEAILNVAAAAMLFERCREKALGPIDMAQQEAAFEAYKAAHASMLETMAFADAMAAKRAFMFFLNLVDANCADGKVIRQESRIGNDDPCVVLNLRAVADARSLLIDGDN